MKSRPAPVGIVGSSGGSALAAAVECLRSVDQVNSWVVLTDRPCGLLSWAKNEGMPHCKLSYSSCDSFSRGAEKYFKEHGVERVLLFYTRRVGGKLFNTIETSNIHPSLLPAYPGLGSVAKAVADGARTIGATLHRVDAGLDTGPIIRQVQSRIESETPLEKVERVSFVQKVWLTLYWYQCGEMSRELNLRSEVNTAFQEFCNRINFDTPIQVLPVL